MSGYYGIVTVDYTSSPPSLTINQNPTIDFGNQCINTTSSSQYFYISGTYLPSNIAVNAPGNFSVSLDNSTFSSSVSINKDRDGSGTVNWCPVYIKFSPTAVQGYSGNITNVSGSASVNVSVSGSGVTSPPSVSSPFSSTISSSSANMGGSITSVGCSNVTERGIYWSTVNGFTPPGQGTKVSESGSFGSGDFSEAVNGLTAGTTYYFKAFATNSNGTTYTSQGTYTYNDNGNGYQSVYTPNAVVQFNMTSFSINDTRIIFCGYGNNHSGVIMKTDTCGNLMNTWSLDESSSFILNKIKRLDANNSIFIGTMNTTPFPNQNYATLIGTFNHTTGVVNAARWWNDNRPFTGPTPWRTGAANGNDMILLTDGNILTVGSVEEGFTGSPGSSNLGMCGGDTWNGYGFIDQYMGTTSYNRGSDVFIMKTNTNGDTAVSGGFFKKFSIAYSGGLYDSYVVQPTAVGHTDGDFCYSGIPSWIADSTRNEGAGAAVEVGTDLFMVGVTVDWRAQKETFTNIDHEAFVIKANSSGNLQWCRTYYITNTASAYEEGQGIAAVTSGAGSDVIITMRSEQSHNVELARIANANGNIVWAKSYHFSSNARPWGIKRTSFGTFIIGIVLNSGSIGGYDIALMEIDASGNVIQTKGYGTVNNDGQDILWQVVGASVDQFSNGSKSTSSNYAITGVTNYTGGSGGGFYIVKAGKTLGLSSGCGTNEFDLTPTVTDRNSGGVNQLLIRKPVVYQFGGGPDIKTSALTISVGTLINTSGGLICSTTLPIELSDFDAKCNNDNVRINWTTVSETNNDFFTIEKSTDGIDYIKVGTIQGAGNSNETIHYQYTDNETSSDHVYYRLKQTDFDGMYTYSDPAVVVCEPAENNSITIYPNPNDGGSLFIDVNGAGPCDAKVTIMNILGKAVFEKNIKLEKNNETIVIETDNRLTPGSYIVNITFDLKTYTKTLMVK